MRRRWLLIGLGVTMVALGGYFLTLDERMRDAGGPGIVTFEFAGSEERAAEIRADWGSDGRDAATESLWVDFAFLLAYGAFLAVASAATRDVAGSRGWRRMAAGGVAAVPLAAAAASCDALENVGLLLALDGHGGDLAPRLAAICAGAKFLLVAAVIGYLIVGVILRLRQAPERGPG